MERYELIIIGAGPAGLSAAIEAAKSGMKTIVFDENEKPGGQLFKQIHKFFGSNEHKAKVRGFKIGYDLLKEAEEAGVKVLLKATVMGIFPNKEVTVVIDEKVKHYKGDNIIVATGASENMIPFEGWTLPGVIGAGAAQTMMNLHGVMPGQKVLMVGSGNVGLVVSYQLKQAGCDVVAVIDAAPRIGGYGVHAAKVARTGVPFYSSYTILKAEGEECVTGATIIELDSKWQQIKGTEKHLDVDTICIAVGLSPMSQLTRIAGCKMIDNPRKGGLVPEINEFCETSVAGIFAAGDVKGIEEASSAMISGRIAALAALKRAGYLSESEFSEKYEKNSNSLHMLHGGMFNPESKGCVTFSETDEGFPLSKSLLTKGYMTCDELISFPSASAKIKGIHPVIECTQNIPCNPCQDACKNGCIKVGSTITNLPVVNSEVKCTGCGLCVASCSGQAIFLVNEDYEEGFGTVSLPYEFLPLPSVGDVGTALDRSGLPCCSAEIVNIKQSKVMDCTAVLTMKVPVEKTMTARFYKSAE